MWLGNVSIIVVWLRGDLVSSPDSQMQTGHKTRTDPSHWHTILYVAMSDVQNFFLEALAVIFVKVQYLYFKRKLSVSSIRWHQFPVAHSTYSMSLAYILYFMAHRTVHSHAFLVLCVGELFLSYLLTCNPSIYTTCMQRLHHIQVVAV